MFNKFKSFLKDLKSHCVLALLLIAMFDESSRRNPCGHLFQDAFRVLRPGSNKNHESLEEYLGICQQPVHMFLLYKQDIHWNCPIS